MSKHTRTYNLLDTVLLTVVSHDIEPGEKRPEITLNGFGLVFDMGEPGDDPVHLKLTALSGGIAQDPGEISTLLRSVADQLADLPAPTTEHHE